MVKAILTIVATLLSLWKARQDPAIRKELIKIAQAKYADQALFLAVDMIDLTKHIRKIDADIKKKREQKSRTQKTIQRIIALDNKKQALWKKFTALNRKFTRLLIKE